MNKVQRLIVTGATALSGLVGGIIGHNKAEKFAENKIEMYAKQGKTPEQQQELRKDMENTMKAGGAMAEASTTAGYAIGSALATFIVVGGGMMLATRKKEVGYGTPQNKKKNGAQP